MKKIILLSIIALLLLGAAAPVAKLMRLEIINKSAYPAYIELDEVNYRSPARYYLSVDGMEEDGLLPVIKTFTLVRGFYTAKIWYCNLENPTYAQFDFTWSAVRLPIPDCASTPPKGDEQHIKLNPNLYPPIDVFGVPIYYDFGYRWRY